MATSAIKVLTDDDDEQDRRRSFYGQLEAFLRRKSNGVVVLPSINGRRIDLYRLYRRVTQLGGWAKVSSAGRWMDVVSATDIGTDCLGAEHGVRTLYMRYLARYEQKQLFGAESDDDEDYPPGAGGSGGGGGGGGSGRTPRVRGSGNHLLLSSPRFMVDATANPRRFGQNGELDLQTVRGSDLMRSLQSGIPMEVDLAVDACVLLSLRPGNLAAMFDLNALIAVLLAHIGIFEDGRVSYRAVYHEAWLRNSGRQFISFWYELVESPELRDLLGPPEVPRMFTRRDLMLGSQVDKEDEILTRMEQVATALLNFSFNPSCVKYLSASKVLFKYILIGVNCSNPQLAVMAFDLLANIADRIKLEPADSLATQLLFETLQAAVYSADRVRLVRALEVLGKLSKSSSSMPLLYELLDEKVVDRLVALLSIKDIMITVGLLECMLMLTESGTVCCDRLVSNNYTISLLVSMLTAEAYSFAPDGLTGLTVLEINVPQPGANSRASSSPAAAAAASSGAGRVANARTTEMYPRLPAIGRRPFGPSASPARFARPVMTAAAGRCSPVPNATLLYRPTTPAGGGRMMQPCTTGPVYVDRRSAVGAPSGQGRWTESFRGPAVTTCQDQQNEAAAVAWIKENCAADQGSIVSRGELYAVYVRCMTSKNLVALSANIFSNLIRQVFPSCVLRQLSGAGAKSGLMQIEGIRFVTDVKSQHPLMAQMLGAKNAATAAGGAAPQQSSSSKSATDCWPLTTTAPGRCDSAGGNNGGGAGSESSSVSNTPESMCSSSSVGDVSLSSVSAGRQARRGSCKLPPSSSTSTTSVGHLRVPNGSSSSTCQLEICHPAEEATSLIEISGMHEAKIVRVENKALTSPSSSSSSSSSSNSVAVGCMLNNNDTSLVVNGQLAAGKLDNEPDGDACVVNGIGGGKVSSNESTASDSGGGAKEEVGILDGTAEYGGPAEGGGTDVESIKQNVTQCQKNIQQLLGTSHSNGCQKRGSGAVGRKRRLNDSSNSNNNNNNACAMPLLAEHLQQQQEVNSGGEDIGPTAVKAPYIAGSNNNTDNGCETPPPTSTTVNPTLCAARVGPPNSSAHPPSRGPPSTPHPGSLRLNLMCEWSNCGRLFPSAQAVCNHVYHEHIGDVSQQCKWVNCDNTVRLKWSLVAHVQDVHCNEYALRAAAVRRYELATTGQSSIPEIRPPPPHPGYAPDAAMAAIRRHSLVNLPKDVTEENEGPVTKNIRITSALILRNMARHSAEARRRLKCHVRHLAYLACSKLDCHRVLEQCLAAIDEPEAEEEGGGLECVPS